jgi:hypothetical protein
MLAFWENTSLCRYSVGFEAVLGFRICIRIRIRRFLMLLGLPNPDPFVTRTDPDPAGSGSFKHQAKIVIKP